MKTTYISPQSTVVTMQCRMMLTASRFNNEEDEQHITPDDDEYNEGFTVKSYTMDNFFDEW